ncbi:MAG: LysE family transporter [Dactylosporangium sp.]|nr:LysE family transporter [Dactylosporangium sp.]NNJ59818.1 LysE family transporter [Dactylosporangium sp.]
MITSLLAGLLAGYGIAIPVGAIGALIVGLTARTSLRVGASAALGVATADGLYAIIAVLGGAALARAIETFATPLRWVSAAILMLIALRTALGALHDGSGSPAGAGNAGRLGHPARAYVGLLGLTLLNPMTIVYFGALVVGGQAAIAPSSTAQVAFVAGAFTASASWQLLLAVGGSLLGRVLTGPAGQRSTALVSSVVVLVLAGALLLG